MPKITDYHAKYYAWELRKRHPIDSPQKIAGAVANATVDLNPHQVDAALFAFKSPLSKGAILADEVGLGKTIEAGLVIAQKWAERKRKILIITPANLRKQWNQELLEKFFTPSRILEGKSYKEEVKNGNSHPFDIKDEIVICSFHFASGKHEDIRRINWDLVVIDEAHRLRNVYKSSSKIANILKSALKEYPKILLTATPLQNSLLELYGLVSVIDEHVFGSLKSFRNQYSNLRQEWVFANLKERLKPICHRTLRKQVRHYIPYTKRTAIVERFVPGEEEQRLYNLVSEYLLRDQLIALPSGQRSLITLILRKLLASSTFAIAGALETMGNRLKSYRHQLVLESLEEELDEDFETLDEIHEEWEEDVDFSTFVMTEEDEALEREIQELTDFLHLAKSISRNAKGEKLLAGLEKAFQKTAELQGARKAIIFTESRRTQDYLLNLLTESAFSPEEVILFNGTNKDEHSREIYQEWLERNQGTDKVSGSATADLRSALVDYFREKATIMIATEAGAEGINLQFCSLVVNYDLPWNPQRIEQRIGRCHRYGQKHDVVVLNFLNEKNAADKRVYNLLDEKFQLFEGVFGASDEVLGSIGSGVDFEKRIASIYQKCRTSEEIQAEFDTLQKELRPEIDQQMADTRKRLLENFDDDVTATLKSVGEKTKAALTRYEQLLLRLTRYELDGIAQFITDDCFLLSSNPFPEIEGIPAGRYALPRKSEEEHLYRPEHVLAQKIINSVLAKPTPLQTVRFDYSHYQGNISDLAGRIGQEGWMLIQSLSVESMEITEDYLLLAIITDEGEELFPEVAERMLNLDGKVEEMSDPERAIANSVRQDLISLTDQQELEVFQKIEERNAQFFENEVNKLEGWADDRKSTLEGEIKEIDRQIREAKRAATGALPLRQKLEGQKRVRELEKERSKKRRELFETQDQIDADRDELISAVEGKLNQETQTNELFMIKWKLE